MIKVRWYTVENRCTSADVAAYRADTNVSMTDAKRILQNRVGPVLQYYDADAFDSVRGCWGCWTDIPYVTQYRGEPNVD
jgi:hypothetical protein